MACRPSELIRMAVYEYDFQYEHEYEYEYGLRSS